jgi:hypothetical protein
VQERLAQHPLGIGADLSQCAVGAPVLDGGARLETVNAHLAESEIRHEPCA